MKEARERETDSKEGSIEKKEKRKEDRRMIKLNWDHIPYMWHENIVCSSFFLFCFHYFLFYNL